MAENSCPVCGATGTEPCTYVDSGPPGTPRPVTHYARGPVPGLRGHDDPAPASADRGDRVTLSEEERDDLIAYWSGEASRLLYDFKAAEAEAERLRDVVAKVEALVDAEVREAIEAHVRAARADVRCMSCNLRYEERQEYGCHESGRPHDYDEDDLAAAEEIERSEPVEFVTLSVADLRTALATEQAGTGAQDEAGERP